MEKKDKPDASLDAHAASRKERLERLAELSKIAVQPAGTKQVSNPPEPIAPPTGSNDIPPNNPVPLKKTLEAALAEMEAKKLEIEEWKSKHGRTLDAEIEKSNALWEKLETLPQHERRQVLDAAGLTHVSAVPAPRTPPRGSGAYNLSTRPVSTVKTPDWEYWRAMRKAQEWQACALSLNIDPDSMKHHPDGWMAGPDSGPLFTSDSFPSDDVQVKFEKRLKLLRANRYDRAIFTLPIAQNSGLGPNDVLLSEFSSWGLSAGWNDMPPELVALAKPVSLPPPTPPQPVPLSPVISAEEWDALVEQEEEARKDPAYKAAYDRAMSLYIERDRLLECVRQDHPYQDSEIKKRLSEIRKEIAESEAGLGDVSLSKAPTKEYKSPPPKTRIEPQGGDSLTPTIWAICYDLQEGGKKVTARPVMAELKRMAAEKIHPLISTTAGGVKYEYEKGDEQELTSQQLDKRIQEWRKVGG